jgi:plasmid stability protein
MKKLTIAVPEEVYQRARVRAAEQGRSISAVVADFLRTFADQDADFARLEALQRNVQEQITFFRAGDRSNREQVHDRALP